jgi:ATP-binding protein involved in chromosome partitioning
MEKNDILEILKEVIYPGFTKDIVSYGFVKDLQLNGDDLSLVVEIASSNEEVKTQLEKDISDKLSSSGLNLNLTINIPVQEKETSSKGKNIAPQIKSFVMVSSGKGGVGKSTTTLNLAIALAMQGKKVGLLDADIYGPNIPRMLGLQGVQPEIMGNRIKPFEKFGIEMMSMGSLVEEGQSLIWRGAIIMRAITQLLQDVLWSDLDVLVIDMPPGTGDAQLTLAQSVPVTCGICVTTPQTVALDDSKRSLDMFQKLHIPIAGIVENMSGFICPESGKTYDIFGKGTAKDLALEYETTVLGEIPIEVEVREAGDSGKPVVYFAPNSQTAKQYLKASDALWDTVQKVNEDGLATNEAIQPTTGGKSACST